MKAKYTEGPWVNEGGKIIKRTKNSVQKIAQVYGIKESEMLDAHLIAAAPDMLEALERINAKYSELRESCSVEWLIVQNAIAKAKGE